MPTASRFEVKVRGPFLIGSPEADVRRMLEQTTVDVADYGQRVVVADCMRLFKDPTPYYWTQVRTDPVVNEAAVSINDHNVIYGPWLEGVSQRNRETRFKGYSIFRRTAQLLRRQAPEFADRVLARYVARWNGG